MTFGTPYSRRARLATLLRAAAVTAAILALGGIVAVLLARPDARAVGAGSILESPTTAPSPTRTQAAKPRGPRLIFAAPGGLRAAADGGPAAADGRPAAVLPGSAPGMAGPDVSPAGGRLAFSLRSHVWLSVVVSGAAVQLTDGAALDHAPSWSPDGTQLAFDRRRRGERGYDVWVMGADGSRQTNLTATRSGAAPDWSSQGPIAFQRAFGIWRMDADGGGQELLSGGFPGIELAPDWSPDGRRIAFASFSSSGRRSDIWVMGSGGGGKRNLTATSSVRGTAPAFSPDGRRIAFSAPSGIWVMSAEGTGLRNVVRGPGLSTPAWLP